MKGALDWLARTAILALSLVATLSIIGSIAAIPSGRIEVRLGIEPMRQAPQPPSVPEATEDARPDNIAPQADGGNAAAMTSPTPRERLEPWLESISYALIAIATLLAAAVFLLWRALGHLRRLAGAAERRI